MNPGAVGEKPRTLAAVWITYLPALYPADRLEPAVAEIGALFPEELIPHLDARSRLRLHRCRQQRARNTAVLQVISPRREQPRVGWRQQL